MPINPRDYGHDHSTVKSPITGTVYHPGCPACELNNQYINRITSFDLSDEAREKVDRRYRMDGTKLTLKVIPGGRNA